jgi:hypothetical protein
MNVVVEHTADTFVVPTGGISIIHHFRFLIRRRSAFRALWPRG